MQLTGFPPPQTPLLQVVPVVQGFPSSQELPLLAGFASHKPETSLHTPWVQGPWTKLLQSFVPLMQTPAPLQVFVVHSVLIPHTVPAGALVVTHLPVASSHAAVLQATGVA
jgi:hypothetical protein